MARMSIDESFAANRRTSETRCWSEEVERKLILMLYLPPEPAEHSCAALANEPEGSGKTYQFSVTGPLPEPPQAASAIAATAAPATALIWRTLRTTTPLSRSSPASDQTRRRSSTHGRRT